jgi:hypothetical protein
MNFVKHPQHSRFIGAPHGWDEARDGPCDALSVCDKVDGVYAVMESVWEPDYQEAVAMAAGLQNIRLGVFGRVHPVVYMSTLPATLPREELRDRLLKAAQWLAGIAHSHNFHLSVSTLGISEAAVQEAQIIDKEVK